MRYLVAVFFFAFAGCIDAIGPLDPEVGEPLVARCSNVYSDPDNDVSFSLDILPMINGATAQPGCIGCLSPEADDPIGFEITGLNLSSFSTLNNGGINSLTNIVIPGSPCESIVWQKVSPGPPFGSRMPFNGPPFWNAEARRLLADWIAEGARDN